MPKFKITVLVTDDSNQYEESREFDLDTLRTTPNPRQCVVSHFLDLARAAVDTIEPKFHI